jgi:hypothetical protein
MFQHSVAAVIEQFANRDRPLELGRSFERLLQVSSALVRAALARLGR